MFRVIGRGKTEAHSRMEASRDHEHLEVILDSACVMAEDRVADSRRVDG